MKETKLDSTKDCNQVSKPGVKRLLIVFSIIVYVLLGVPIWWQTTRIPRPALPHLKMQQAEREFANSSTLLPVTITVYILQQDDAAPPDLPWVAASLFQHLDKLKPVDTSPIVQVVVVSEHKGACEHAQMNAITSSAGSSTPTCLHLQQSLSALTSARTSSPSSPSTSGTADHTSTQAVQTVQDMHPEDLDDALFDILESRHTASSASGHYTLFVLPGSPVARKRGSVDEINEHLKQAFVGQHRHAWVWAGPDPGHATSGNSREQIHGCGQVSESCAERLIAPLLVSMLFPVSGGTEVDAAGKLPTSADGRTLLLFTLANAGNAGGVASSSHVPDDGSNSSAPGVEQLPAVSTWRPLSWDFDRFSEQYLMPFVHAVSPVLDVSLQSQVRLHTTSKVQPSWSKKRNTFIVKAKQLPYFVDSDWALDFGLDASPAHGSMRSSTRNTSHGHAGDEEYTDATGHSRATKSSGQDTSHIPAHVLHMLMYVPPVTQQPLRVLQQGGADSAANGFWIPSWGAVHVLPRTCNASVASGSSASPETAGVDRAEHQQHEDSLCTCDHKFCFVSAQQQQEFAESVIGSLRSLLGLPGHAELPIINSGKVSTTLSSAEVGNSQLRKLKSIAQVLPSESGVASWEVDRLIRARTAADISAAARILGSFSRLSQQLPNLAMPDLVGDYIHEALQSLKRAVLATRSGDHAMAAESARKAHGAAEAGFSHPSILAQLSFPESHKVGVYMPFFFPALFPVMMAFITELRRYLQRRRAWMKSGKPAAQHETMSVEERDRLEILKAMDQREFERLLKAKKPGFEGT